LDISERKLSEIWLEAGKEREKLSENPITFFEQVVGFKPTSYQVDLAKKFTENQFVCMRWCRQSGKSWIAAALLLNYALMHPASYIGIVAPGWRQSKLIIRRIRFFLRKLPKDLCPKPARTVLYFSNESIIEAFPNNPDTIRGPTLQVIYWDEANFTPDDIDLWTAILFTISTTKGKVLVSSTPWNTDSVFYRMFHGEEFKEFSKSHVTWKDALQPNGPLDPKTLESIRKQFEYDPWRFRRECEAEWAEDEDVWLPQSLIVACVGTEKNCGEDLQPWNAEKGYEGDLFAGLDLAQVRDFCVFSVIERRNDRLFLRHLKIFSQPTKYAHVLGYVKTLQDRWGGFAKIRVDFTKEGPSIISDMETAGIKNAEGVNFNVARKSEMVNLLKQRMADERFFYPLLTWEKPYRSDVCTELNVEKYELRKDGTIMLSHPTGTHDDVFWSIALAVYATVEMKPVDLEALRFG
jgi:phage FluMu gp28-like protein